MQDSEQNEMPEEDSEDKKMSYQSSRTSNQAEWHVRNSKTELEAPMLEVK